MMSCVIGTLHIRMIKSKELDVRGMWHVWGCKEIHTRFWLGNLNDCGHLGKLDVQYLGVYS